MVYASRDEAKANGWFSRRHETSEANTEARERYQANTMPAARIARRLKRIAKANKNSE